MPQSRVDGAAEVPRYLICLLPALIFAQSVGAQEFDAAWPSAVTTASIADMGTLGVESVPFGISGNGKVVVGTSNFRVTHWTKSTGLADFGKLPDFAQAQANSVS